MSSTDFYRAFEERHRGPRELIQGRLEAYLPFITPLRELYRPATAIDLGCGRGEWLELLQNNGFQPHGVDLDDGMLAACTERGLPVTQGDAIAHLKSMSDESQCVVSGFHIAEHIAFGDLETLVIHSLRVLKPGGLLILETPNPENVVVGTSSFYLDPTHLRPIPPLLMSFLPEHHGFTRVRTVRLQEARELHERTDIGLMDVLGGVSPDYAIVAQKAADAEILAKFDAAFAAHHGLELHELAGRYDHKLDQRLNVIDQRLGNAEAQAGGMAEALGRIALLQDRLVDTTAQFARVQADFEQLQREAAHIVQRMEAAEGEARAAESRVEEMQAKLEQLEVDLGSTRKELHDVHQSNHHHWQQWETTKRELEAVHHANHNHWQLAEARHQTLSAVHRSLSWRITAPLRFVAGLLIHPGVTMRNSVNHAVHRAIEICHRPLSWLIAVVLRRPQLAYRINQLLMRYPALHLQLQSVARRAKVIFVGSGAVSHASQSRHVVSKDRKSTLLTRRMLVLLRNKALVSCVHAALKPFPKLHAYAIRKVTGMVSGAAQPIWRGESSRSLGSSSMQEPAQLLLDVTGLIREDAGTGVQRAVRSLLLELISNPPARYVVKPVFATLGEQGYRYAGEMVMQLYGIGEERIGVVEPRRGDIFIGLDLQHALVIQNQGFFDEIRSLGIRVYFVVYDLLPVRYPSYFRPEMESLHREWLKVVASVDGALCISKTVANDLQAWIDRNEAEAASAVSIHHFSLGSEFPEIIADVPALPNVPDILATPRNRPSFLMVGTIEPRKGHALVLAAFDHLWKDGKNFDLIIVGRPGWMMDDFINRLRFHPELGQRLHWLEGADDRTLALAYRCAACLIAASECEGYGLPLVEAARYGLPMIARDIEPFREIADSSAYFFSAGATPHDLAECIQTWLELYRSGRHPRPDSIQQITWMQSAKELLECIDPVVDHYIAGGGDRKDGEATVDMVLSGIRCELSGCRERVQ